MGFWDSSVRMIWVYIRINLFFSLDRFYIFYFDNFNYVNNISGIYIRRVI